MAALLLQSTFKELPVLLQYSKAKIQRHFALTEAQFGPTWIVTFIWYIHDKPEYKDYLLYDALNNSANKPAAAYLASIFLAYYFAYEKLSSKYDGYQQLEHYFKQRGTIKFKICGKTYYFKI
jgi:hypothetical protein